MNSPHNVNEVLVTITADAEQPEITPSIIDHQQIGVKLFTTIGFTPQLLAIIGYYWLLLLLFFCKKFLNYLLLLHHAQTLIIVIIAYLLLQLIVSA